MMKKPVNSKEAMEHMESLNNDKGDEAAVMAGDVKELLSIVKTAVDALTAIGAFFDAENLREDGE